MITKKFITIGIGIFVVLAIAWYISYEKNNYSHTQHVQTDSRIQSERDTTYQQLAFPDNTLDTTQWSTYRDEIFGFSVQYPPNWYTEHQAKNLLALRAPTQDPNDDGGVYINIISPKNIQSFLADKKILDTFTHNTIEVLMVETKLGVWSPQHGYPDTREIIHQYICNMGTYYLLFYVPSQNTYRTEVLQQVLLSLDSQ